MFPLVRLRSVALLAASALAAPLLLVGAATPGAAQTSTTSPGVPGADAPGRAAGLDLDEPATVTLITGDRVTVHPGGFLETEPGPGRDQITFDEQHLADAIRVVPSDAAPLLAEGALDERLFDVSYLIREEYDDAHRGDLPLIVQGELAPVREVASGSGARVHDRSPSLKMATMAQDKSADRGRLWSRLTGEPGGPGSLPAGVEKVWLDGVAHVRLDESVPQVGAPQVWDSGHTGAGTKVAVLDTGVDSTHPDLAGQVVADTSFVEDPFGGALLVERLGYPLLYRIAFGAAAVPTEGSSDPVAHVGRACVASEGDELEADPAGKTALIARGVCTFAEKYDAAVDAGATGVVFYNNEPGIVLSGVGEAEHAGEVWAANITADAGQALRDAAVDGDVTLTFTDHYPGDLYGHGTHVAATIAGTGAASGGVRKGVAPDATVMNGKVCNGLGDCQESWVIAGMEWAARNGADVVNLSLGRCCTDGTDPLSEAVNTLTDRHDVLFVVAGGNSGELGPGNVGTPGAADAALTVGAVDKNDDLAGFSSRGPRRGDHAVKPELTAPGVAIVAARAAGTAMGTPIDDEYTSANGTSMATPHVAGAAALLAQARPDFDPSQLKNALTSTATDVGSLWFEQGTGRVDVARAVSQGVYADAAIGFGSLSSSEDPVARQVTYTNLTDRVVNLQLEASVTDLEGTLADAITMSRGRLIIRPGDQATVTATIDPQALTDQPGPHGGVITARADGISVRTALSFGIKRDVVPLPDDWAEDWTATYTFDGPTAGTILKGAALSPNGEQVFLYGAKEFNVDPQMIVMAVDANTGEEIWSDRRPVSYVGPIGDPGIAVAPDGSKVFVTQNVYDTEASRLDVVTIAYNNTPPQQPGDPQLGEPLWQATYEGISPFANAHPGAILRIAVTPDGQSVILAGSQRETSDGHMCEIPPPRGSCHASSMLTIAYDAATGEQRWLARHRGRMLGTDANDVAGEITISSDSELAYVSGSVQLGPDEEPTGITIAYEISGPTKGEIRWLSHHHANSPFPHSVMSQDGERLLITGEFRQGSDFRMVIKALDVVTGEVLWTSKFGAADHGFRPGHTHPDRNFRGGIAVSPDDDLVFVTGHHCEGGRCTGAHAAVTVAFDQASGEQRWHQIHETTGPSSTILRTGVTLTTSPDGSQLYVAGMCCADPDRSGYSEQTTYAYDAPTGELLAVARHQFDGSVHNQGAQILVSPDGSRIYNVGQFGTGFGVDSWGVATYSPPITVSADAYRSRADWHIDLKWTAPGADAVDIYRDNELVATVGDGTTYTDELGKQRPGTTFEYKICASETQHCSKPATVELSVGRPSTVE